MRVNLTERFAKAARADGRKSPIFYDDEVIGFGLQVRDNGRKTFTLDYAFEARRRRYFIGDHPAWTVAAARDEARRLKREVDGGTDPLDKRDERWAAPITRSQPRCAAASPSSKVTFGLGRLFSSDVTAIEVISPTKMSLVRIFSASFAGI